MSDRIYDYLDGQSFVKIQDSSKKLYHFIQSNKLYFLKIIHKYNENLDKQSGTKVVKKAPTGIVKKLALALIEFIKLPFICCYEQFIDYMSNECKSASIHDWHPHHIAAKFGHSELYEDFNPATSFGLSSLHLAADEGKFKVFADS